MHTFTPLRGAVARLGRLLASGAALSVLMAGAVHAQVIPLYGFQATTSPYQALTGATVFDPIAGGGTADDGFSRPQTIGFTFRFGFNTYTEYTLNSNGWITFGPGNTTPYQTPLDGSVNQMIGFFAKDLRTDGAATQYSAVTTGTSPNQIHKIEAKQFVQYANTTAEGSAQLWLYENGNIEVHYGQFNRDWIPGTTNGVQVGLRGNGVADVRSLSGAWNAPVAGTSSTAILPNTGQSGEIPTSGQVFRFTLPAGDLTPPVVGAITLTPPGGTCLPSAHTVSVTPSDASGIASVELSYYVGSNPTPTTVAMTRSGSSYSATIPAQGNNGVRYRVKVTDAGNNSLVSQSAFAAYRDAGLTISAGPDQTTYVGETDTLSASSSLGGTVRITEFTLFRDGTGATSPYPGYIPTTAQDFVEITNLGTGQVDMSNYGFEVQGGGAARTYTFPANVLLQRQEVLVLHVGTGTDDPSNNYYNTGGTTDGMFSGNDQAFVLTSATGQVVDAVVLNTFSPAAPITAADWNGTGVSSPRTVAGAGLYNVDANDITNWADSQTVPQSIGTINPGLPTIASSSPVEWTGALLPSPVTVNPLITPTFTAPGTYTFIASINNGACVATDTVRVTVLAASAPTVDFSVSQTNLAVGDIALFRDLSANRPNRWRWLITPNAPGNYQYFNAAHDSTSRDPWVQFNQPGTYSVRLVASNAAGQNVLTRTGYITVGQARYCQNVNSVPCTAGYIDAVSILGTTLRNRGTGCTSGATGTGYTNFPPTDSTTATMRRAQTYNLTVTGSSAGGIYAWIDFNNDGVFDTTRAGNEAIRVRDRTTTPGQPATVQITIPDSAALNVPVGMRIRNRRNANVTLQDPCTIFFDGETEDYTVQFLPALPNGTAAERISLFDVYPNPSAGLFRVRLRDTGARQVSMTVVDAVGRVVHTQTGRDNQENVLRLENLPAGIYTLRVNLDGATAFRRIQVQK